MKDIICPECGCLMSSKYEECPTCGADLFPADEDDEDDEKKYSNCACCGAELGDEYHMYADNFLQVKYFEADDGSDNAFCSESCAGESLMLATVENKPGGHLFI